MRLVPFASDMAAGVAECYNDLIAPVPECHPVPPDRFADLEGLASQHLRDERLMVAQAEPGGVRGFVHVGIVAAGLDYRPPVGPGTIRFLAYHPGERPVGKLLLDWAEAWAREQECTVITAWNGSYPYPFYYFPDGAQLSEHIGHVRALFGMAGFQERGSELLLTWRDFVPPVPQPPGVQTRVGLDRRPAPESTSHARTRGTGPLHHGQGPNLTFAGGRRLVLLLGAPRFRPIPRAAAGKLLARDRARGDAATWVSPHRPQRQLEKPPGRADVYEHRVPAR